MNDEDRDLEGHPVPDIDDAFLERPAPGRSVFGDEEPSFAEDDDAVPHWREPPTGSVPMIGTPSPVSFDPEPEPRLSEADPAELAAWSSSSPGAGGGSQWSAEAFEQPPAPTVGGDGADEFFAFDDDSRPPRPPVGREAPPEPAGHGPPSGGQRDMPLAVVVGVGLAALILAALAVGPQAALAVVTIALGLAAVEYFNALRLAGYQPAVLLGLACTVALPLAAYWRGQEAMLLVIVLALTFGALWYLSGVSEGAVRGLGGTLIGIVQIGVLGAFAALMLSVETYGTGLLTAAIVLTVAYDVGGLVIGSLMGRTPLSPASPNKTMEGLIGGMAVTVGAAIIMGGLGQPAPLANADTGGGMVACVVLGTAVAIAAPIGDLSESLLKRDLGIKDMGSILPGHGGLFDRLDAMLCTMPVTWYVSQALLT